MLGGWLGDDELAVGDADLLTGDVFELASQAAGLTVLVDTGVVEVGAEVVVARLRVRQQVPDDGQYRVANGDQGFLLARCRTRRR